MTQSSDRPNILIFMTDQQQGATAMPGHGCRMPHLRRFAEQGIGFNCCHCPAAHCCPSRATFFTGQMPSRHGVFNNVLTPTAINGGIPASMPTFGDQLRHVGYDLAFSGKWHLSDRQRPSDRGWDELHVVGAPGQRNGPLAWHWAAGGAKGTLPGTRERRRGEVFRPGWGDFTLYSAVDDSQASDPLDVMPDWRDIVKPALERLPDLARGRRDEGKPWCLYVGVGAPHDTYHPPQSFLDKYDLASVPLPASFGDTMADRPGIYRRQRQQVWSQLSPEEHRECIAHYWALCDACDEMFARTLAALDDTGQADDTLVLYLSDHGDYAGAHGLWCKGVPAFDEAYHVPCAVRWPRGMASGGQSVEAFVGLEDFAPTFLELAGVPQAGLSGQSLLPFLRGETPADWRRYRHTQFNGVEMLYTQRSVADERFKYVFNGFDFDELYDLEADPHEMTNLADDPKLDTVKRRLCREMWRYAVEQHDDRMANPYFTVALAPYGPADVES